MATTQPANQISSPHARRTRRPLTDTLSNLPAKIGTPILTPWNTKEDLLDLLALARTQPDRQTVARLLHRFYARCATTDLLELHRLATTIETWWPEILAFLHTGITNAGSEGTNRVIKTVARDAYGFRNPENQRLRTRTATTRRHRGNLHRLPSKSRFHPLGAWCANTGEALAMLLRPVTPGSNTVADHIRVLGDAIAQLPCPTGASS